MTRILTAIAVAGSVYGWTTTVRAQCAESLGTAGRACVEAAASAKDRPRRPPLARAGQVVVVQPAPPPVVVVQPAPPPPPPVVMVQPAPPPVVVVQPAPPPPPPVVMVQPAPPPQQVVVVHQPQPRVVTTRTTTLLPTDAELGIHAHIGGFLGAEVQMGGATGAIRYRPIPRFALDFGIGGYAGTDYNGQDRVEVPLTIDALLYVNPSHPLQAYFLAGVGVSWAFVEGVNENTGRYEERDLAHLGGQIGVGLEWRLFKHLAFTADIRGFLRRRIDDDPQPEFVNDDGETTDTSGGGLGTIGVTLYF
ncbi:MAG: hypothetical protein AAF355_01565 [Myxococcota bacterium]